MLSLCKYSRVARIHEHVESERSTKILSNTVHRYARVQICIHRDKSIRAMRGLH